MSEALQQLVDLPGSLAEFAPEQKQDEAPKEEAKPVESDPLVEKARTSGWRPKEEFEGDPDTWVDAGEFVRRKPLFDQIHALKKEVKAKSEQVDQVSKYASKAAEKAKAELLKQLEQQKEQAFQAGDYRAFSEADRAHREAEADVPVKQAEVPQIDQNVQAFTERNANWFDKDRAMTAYALSMAEDYIKGQGMSMDDALKKVDADVRKEFAHKFTNPNKEKPASVVSDVRDQKQTGKQRSYNELSREERSVWASLKNTGMSFDEFVKGLE